MYCPECGGEYRKGFTHCADCDVDLVEALPVKTPLPDVGLVTVLETGDPSELVFAESVLQQAGIPFVKKGDSLQELFALGRLGTGFNPIAGPVVLLVSEDQAEAAAQLLE
ncbi:MAG TPA: DUF2007 domain-containing protein, partial [Thermoanaerobaculia bacterium]